jgi:hypothetical protein
MDGTAYVENLAQRLSSKGFAVKRELEIGEYRLSIAAVKTKFELGKLGKVARFVLGLSADHADIHLLQSFSAACTTFAVNNFYSKYGAGGVILVVPFLVSSGRDGTLEKWLTDTPAPKHVGAFEFPVLVSVETNQVYYRKKTPVWGAAYYGGFRKFVEEIFISGA